MPPAFFSVDPHGGAPLYQQLAEQIKRAIAIGALSPGERLPTVKGLAQDLKLNANTVARVYRDLEREGVIATATGRGSFVSQNGALDNARKVALDVVTRGVESTMREARSLGLTQSEIRAIADASIAHLFPEEKK